MCVRHTPASPSQSHGYQRLGWWADRVVVDDAELGSVGVPEQLAGDPLLSVRGDTAEECWRIVDPVLEAWQQNRTPLDAYPAGSTGPAAWE
jgi:hypothetical protein